MKFMVSWEVHEDKRHEVLKAFSQMSAFCPSHTTTQQPAAMFSFAMQLPASIKILLVGGGKTAQIG